MNASLFDPEHARKVAPFAAAVLIGIIAATIPPTPHPIYIAVACGLLAIVTASTEAIAWLRPPRAGAILAPLSFLALVPLLSAAKGNSPASFAPLVMLPVFWVALYGTRREIAMMIGGIVCLFLAPLSHNFGIYGAVDRIDAALWVGVSTLVGFTVQAMVSRQRTQGHALAEQRDFLDAMFNSTASLVAVLDTSGRIERVNPACERSGGFFAADVVGRRFWEVVVPDGVVEAERERWSNLRPEELEGETETPMFGYDGAVHVVHWMLSPMRDAKGTVVRMIATGLDVTEKRATQEALRVERDRFESVLRASTEYSIIGVDNEAVITLFNQGAERMLGYAAEEMIGKHAPAVLHDPEQVAERSAELEVEPGIEVFFRAAREGHPETRDWIHFRADGTRIPVSLTVTAIPGPDGEPEGFIGIGKDVSRQREVEAALVESDQRYRRLVANLPDTLIMLFDRDLRCLAADGAILAQGSIFEDSKGKPVSELFSSENEAILRQRMEAALAGEPSTIECESVRRPGRFFEVEVVPYDREGEILGVFAVFRDITRRHLAEAEARAAEERFVDSFSHAPLAMIMLDLEGRFIDANLALTELTGYPCDDLIGKPTSTMTHPDDNARDSELRAGLLAGEADRYQREKRLIDTDGNEIDVSVDLSLVRGLDGSPRYFVGQIADITERMRHERELQYQADHDHMTGLLNRGRFEAEVENHIAQIARYGTRGAAIVLDIDHFKRVNDTLGHAKGDELIIDVARVLSAQLRESDRIGRLGGDEFAILLPNADREQAEAVAAKVVEGVRQEVSTLVEEAPGASTISVGVEMFSRDDGLTAADVIVHADLAMYEAKGAGGDTFVFFEEDRDQPRIGPRITWFDRIDRALEAGDFVLSLEPIVDLGSQRTVHRELLVQMLDEQGNLVPASTLYYVAERNGQIAQLDSWAAAKAVELVSCSERAGEAQPLAVNLSDHSVGDPNLVGEIEDRIADLRIHPGNLIFEISEAAVAADIGRAQRLATRLAELGCHLALDQFGADLGSIYHLRHLPFDYVKIAGEFVNDCHGNHSDELAIAAIVAMAQGLGKRTIAEAVPNAETAALLGRLRVDLGQGDHFGAPEELTRSIRISSR